MFIGSVLLFGEDRRDFLVVVHALDHVGKEVGDRQHREFVQVLVGVERNGVRHDHLFEGAFVDTLVGRAGKHGVGDGGANALRSAGHEHVGCHADRAGGVDHVVDDQHITAFDIADGSHFTHDVGLGALLVRNDDRRAEQFRISVCPLGAAHVGRCDREILDVEALDVGYENTAGVEGVDRDIEKSLNLVGMQVHRHHAVDTCGHQHVGHQFGADRHAGTVFAVLARPAEVGHYGYDLVGRSAACCVDHHQQFHQRVRGREGRLDDEDRAATDRLAKMAMVIRVNQMAAGFTGMSEAAANAYMEYINNDVYPLIPSRGSEGANDLSMVTHIGLALMGEWDVNYKGKRVAASKVRKELGLKRFRPFGMDGISILSNSNAAEAQAVAALKKCFI